MDDCESLIERKAIHEHRQPDSVADQAPLRDSGSSVDPLNAGLASLSAKGRARRGRGRADSSGSGRQRGLSRWPLFVNSTPHLSRVTHANTFSRVAQDCMVCVISKKSHPHKRISCRTRDVHGLTASLYVFCTTLRLYSILRQEYPLQSATRSSVWPSCRTEPDYTYFVDIPLRSRVPINQCLGFSKSILQRFGHRK